MYCSPMASRRYDGPPAARRPIVTCPPRARRSNTRRFAQHPPAGIGYPATLPWLLRTASSTVDGTTGDGAVSLFVPPAARNALSGPAFRLVYYGPAAVNLALHGARLLYRTQRHRAAITPADPATRRVAPN
ncbi:hypothetical protein GCM10010123_32590 [Pilimelia anulata]|uniref:Uncharacterized protein n=1 Tax=Pilimelia anulata TaxID=53371 RepID=A0A8J3BFI1_9ACTN|nr:hypothetical protein GCM10010123_32590 [Pilimelia anulata]